MGRHFVTARPRRDSATAVSSRGAARRTSRRGRLPRRLNFRFTCQTVRVHMHAHSNRRDSSSPLFVRRGGRRPFPSLTGVRERSAGRALWSSSRTLRCCAPCDRHAHPPALHRGDFGLGHRASSSDRRTISSRYPGSACALPFIQTSPSHSRRPPHRGRTVPKPPGTGLRTSPAGATPCSANMTPHESALS